jgi:hypothetical protein
MEQFQGRVTHRVVTRYHSDWSTYWDWINTSVSVPAGKEHRKNPQMRFSFKGRLLDIKTAQRYDEVNGFLEFYCEEKQ